MDNRILGIVLRSRVIQALAQVRRTERVPATPQRKFRAEPRCGVVHVGPYSSVRKIRRHLRRPCLDAACSLCSRVEQLNVKPHVHPRRLRV